jgi:hypothetical protein
VNGTRPGSVDRRDRDRDRKAALEIGLRHVAAVVVDDPLNAQIGQLCAAYMAIAVEPASSPNGGSRASRISEGIHLA